MFLKMLYGAEVYSLTLCMLGNYSLALKKWGYTGFGLSVMQCFYHSVGHNLVSTQYLDFTKFYICIDIDKI